MADDFTITGQKGETAKVVLKQLFSQLGEKVISHQEIKQSKIDNGVELVHNIDYAKMGTKEATLIFNENNLLKELILFKMEIKKINSDTKIEKSSHNIIEIPFTIARKLIAVEVILNGEYRTFILDSGSPKVILNSKYISEQGTTKRTISSTKDVSGNISGMDIENVEQLDFHGIQLNNQEVITMKLSHLEKELGIEFYGLIGYELIKDYNIIFDNENLKLVLINPAIYETYKNEKFSNATLVSVPFDLKSHIPIITAQIGNKDYSFGIDCGA